MFCFSTRETRLTSRFSHPRACGITSSARRHVIKRLKLERGQTWGLLHKVAMAGLALGIVAYGALLVKQDKRYLRQVNNPNAASFEEFASVLRSIIPDGLCPASFLRPVIWLAFP